jgi:hypothetical protein
VRVIAPLLVLRQLVAVGVVRCRAEHR